LNIAASKGRPKNCRIAIESDIGFTDTVRYRTIEFLRYRPNPDV